MNLRVASFLALLSAGNAAAAALWSATELQYQRGDLKAPSFVAGGAGEAATDIFTVQQAAGWEYVDLFAFVDLIDDDRRDGFNDRDLYGEVYLGGGLGKVFGHAAGFGPFRDVGWVFGLNHARDAKVWKYLPGLRLYWDAPGFTFLNTDLSAYVDDSRGVGSGGAQKESDSFWIDVSWARPFEIGNQSFSFEGHMEFIDGRRNEFGGHVSSWILAQPQVRWDLGKVAWGKAGQVLVGFEYQYWRNKLGDPTADERATQLLAVWRL